MTTAARLSPLWRSCTGALALVVSASVVAGAQDWPLHAPQPPAGASRVIRDVTFAESEGGQLRMDVYRPTAGGPAPAVIFYTLYWPAEGQPARKDGEWYKAWAHLAAANGIVAILPDLRAQPGTGNASGPAQPLGDDFQKLTGHLTARAADYGIDPDRIALFAESGATWAALPLVEDPSQTAVKAAVLYYGAAAVETFRADVPLLWVRAALDSARTNNEIVRLASLALSQNAPVTIVNHPTGRHGFEGRDDNAITRSIIEQTLAFIGRATSAGFRQSLAKSPAAPR